MKKTLLFCSALFAIDAAEAQVTPEISSWVRNTDNSTGYAGIASNVQTVQYSATQVYVSATCIPGYDIGPWSQNPNVPSNQNFVFKITRSPQQNTGTQTTVGLGHCGVWSNGVSIFNADDGQSYNNADVWKRNAYYWEGVSFDDCLGHAAQNGEYHHHVNPTCLYDDTDSTNHAPIIGYAFDGFPIYGAYAYANTDGTGAIKRMTSSYQLRNITTRTTLPDGSTASSAGPAVSSSYPIGSFLYDYEYISGSGDLDEHNGRFCITPDYPAGTYAYFVTIDASLNPVYPFVLGLKYYGTVQSGNTGPSGGHVTISETTTVYNPTTTGINEAKNNAIKFQIMPNPTQDYAYIYMDANSINNVKGSLFNAKGQLVQTIEIMQPSIAYTLDLSKLASGMYLLQMEAGDTKVTHKVFKSK